MDRGSWEPSMTKKLLPKPDTLILLVFIYRENSKEEQTFWSLMVMYNIFSLALEFIRFYCHISGSGALILLIWKSIIYTLVAQKKFLFPTSVGCGNFSVRWQFSNAFYGDKDLLYLLILRYIVHSVCDKENVFFSQWKCLKSDVLYLKSWKANENLRLPCFG